MVRSPVAILTRGPLSTIFAFALYCAQRHYLKLSCHSFYHFYHLDFLWIHTSASLLNKVLQGGAIGGQYRAKRANPNGRHSPLPGFKSRLRHVREFAVTLGLGRGFRRVLRFHPLLTTG